MAKLVLIRHGECIWQNREFFSGWVDIPLSSNGILDAIRAGEKISDVRLDIVFTSMQIRAIETAMIAFTQNHVVKMPVLMNDNIDIRKKARLYSQAMDERILPVFRSRSLNEQCELEDSINDVISDNIDEPATKKRNIKTEMQNSQFVTDCNNKKMGPHQSLTFYRIHPDDRLNKLQTNKTEFRWCRSYNKPSPNCDCLRDTSQRTIPFFEENIVPLLETDKNILISAHDYSLRSIIMFIDGLHERDAFNLEIPSGKPLIYEYTNAPPGRFKPS